MQEKGTADWYPTTEWYTGQECWKTLINIIAENMACQMFDKGSCYGVSIDYWDSFILQELYALVEFVNPGMLGTSASFRHVYEEPIVASQQPQATEEERRLGQLF